MAKTLGCADVGYDCVYRITTDDGDEQLIVDATIEHAKRHHPELTEDVPTLSNTLRNHIKNLLDQSGYTSRSND